ncbi:hypothetical protein D1AOALGA4SA_10569 [Olavius algarvensis Delta 1 endosymbiont]|nr:hypothetical protein D1AOALGA4SA_10569 [Olavius algarvensis Delta 1 endosymbiont]
MVRRSRFRVNRPDSTELVAGRRIQDAALRVRDEHIRTFKIGIITSLNRKSEI